jgi:hypothetical protein
MIDYSLWGLNVKGYHFINILLHILAALCIYWLISNLCHIRLLAFITGLLYLAHPIHSEAVSYIAGRADPLSAVFILLSFIFYVKQIRSHKAISLWIAMLFCYLCALLSKEHSLILPLLLLLYHYVFREKIKIKYFLSILGITLLYILSRGIMLRSIASSTSVNSTLLQRVPGFFVAIAEYFRLLLLPFNLHMEYGSRLFSFMDREAGLGILILFILLIYAFRERGRSRLISFFIFWFFITLLPVSNLYPINAFMAEHWLYLPAIGFFLILANAITFLYNKEKLRAIAVFLIVCLVSFYSYLTVRQNEYWRDSIAFCTRTLRYAPNSWRCHNELGIEYENSRRNKEAVAAIARP